MEMGNDLGTDVPLEFEGLKDPEKKSNDKYIFKWF